MITNMDTYIAGEMFSWIVPSLPFRNENVTVFTLEPFSRGALQVFLSLCEENNLKASGAFDVDGEFSRVVIERPKPKNLGKGCDNE